MSSLLGGMNCVGTGDSPGIGVGIGSESSVGGGVRGDVELRKFSWMVGHAKKTITTTLIRINNAREYQEMVIPLLGLSPFPSLVWLGGRSIIDSD